MVTELRKHPCTGAPKSRFLLADIIAFSNAWYFIHVLSRAAALMIGQHAGFTHICIHTGLRLGICFLGLCQTPMAETPMAATPRRPEVPHLLNNILEKPFLRNARTTIPDINACKPANTKAVSACVHMYRFRYSCDSCMCLSTHTCTQYTKCMCTHVHFRILMHVFVNTSISLLAQSQAPLVASASPHVEPDAEVLG